MNINNGNFETLIYEFLKSYQYNCLPETYLTGSGVEYVDQVKKTLVGYSVGIGYRYPDSNYISNETVEVSTEDILVFIFNRSKENNND